MGGGLHKGQRGDDAASRFVELYWHRWKGEVLATVRGKIRSLPDLDLQACYNAAWTDLFDRLQRNQPPDNPRGFLIAVTTNKAIDELRKCRRTSQAPPIALAHVEDPSADVAAIIANRETLERWRRRTASFGAHQRDIARLAAFGFTRREIAEQLGIREKAVHRAFESDRSKNHIGISAKLRHLQYELHDAAS